MMVAAPRLKVGIIGAGIAGLSAAIALRRAGWDVEVYEKSRFKNEAGAAVTIGCNANRVLRRFGANFEAWGATDNMQFRSPRGDTLQEDYIDSFAEVPQRYGERWLFFHRQDLHSGLRRMAEDPTIADAPPAKIHLGCSVEDLNCEAGCFTLADGRQIEKDMLVIANGIHCQFVEKVTGVPSPVKKTGRTVHRFLVPMSEILADPLTAQIFEGQANGLVGPRAPGSNSICASYPCRNGTVLNLTYMSDTKPENMANMDWNTPTTPEEVEEVTKGFHPAFRALPRKANSIGAYNMILRDEVPTFINGKTILIGDAAHPMLQYHAQGASQAIETAGALEIFFNTFTLPPNNAALTPGPSVPAAVPAESDRATAIQTRLQQFNTFRLPRAVTTQVMSSLVPCPKTYPEVVKRVRKVYQGPLPPGDTPMWGQAFRDFFFSYDVQKESRLFLEKCCVAAALPHVVVV